MVKKRIFSIPKSLDRGFTDTITAARNNAGQVRFEVIPLSRIETDPENPRELLITEHEIKLGINSNDPSYKDKQQEIENLQTLSYTIKNNGLINPIVVYKFGEKYRLVAGERRFLASLIADKEDIQARILNQKPSNMELRLLQWIENTEREDLSLKDRLGNIKAIINEYEKINTNISATPTILKELTGISKSQASCYLSVINAPDDVRQNIFNGKINNLDKAAFIAKIENPEVRDKAIKACVEGEPLKQIRNLIESHQQLADIQIINKKSDKTSPYINLGKTKNIYVIKKIINIIAQQPEFKFHLSQLQNINWDVPAQVTKAFQTLLTVLDNSKG